jgi:ribosomal protein S18 acetylase RimI-like enzyme
VDEALSPTSVEEYQFVVATIEGRVVGYTCFGPVPLTQGVWDLYWIAVDPAVQRVGLGARLQAATEEHIKARGGRLLLAETSSLDSYAAARSFYLNRGYQLLDRLPDFYRSGDDRLTFGKRL